MNGKVIDVFPQVLRVECSFTAGTYTEVEIPTGLAALRAMQFRANKRTAMELLKLKIYEDEENGGTAGDAQVMTLATVSRAAIGSISDRGVLHKFRNYYNLQGVSGVGYSRNDYDIDLTSGGIGRLVTTDNLYIGCNTANHTGTIIVHFQISFRYVSISLQEYSDIKESQITYD